MTKYDNKGNRLSIQLSLSGFSFLVFAPDENKVQAEKEVWNTNAEPYYDWLKVKLAAEEMFRNKFTITNLLFTPQKITVVPSELLQEEHKNKLFEVTFPLEANEIVISEKPGNYTFLYAIPKNIYDLAIEYFPKAKWKSIVNFLVNSIKLTKVWNIGVFASKGQLYIAIMKNRELFFYNSFSFQTRDDLLYYMLYIFDNFSIPVAGSNIQLWGNRDYVNMLKDELKRYHDAVQIAINPHKTLPKSAIGNLLLSNI